MKFLLLISALILPIGMFAQGNGTGNGNPQVQLQVVNYYNINDDINPVQTNISNQQANPPAQEQQVSSLGNIFGSNENVQQEKPCKDCEELKAAIKSAHAASGNSGGHHKIGMHIKRQSKTLEGKIYIKMKKTFARTYKPKTSYALCFNWH